ncbi:PAS domain S-box-containing protein [Rhodovulum bhavnagarense]|uniref:Sensory/regulatory protein RpfC n=1 Tax=Rhodovulum bhavnagarense TaxID=992286 RepID=A0A4R2RCX5_9RHOB|nr:response regulator [Rhodovulum bhavnagarense]TCP60663.1 PAS domain S-box-containing protein [Rhodovulum bhavnagarense]
MGRKRRTRLSLPGTRRAGLGAMLLWSAWAGLSPAAAQSSGMAADAETAQPSITVAAPAYFPPFYIKDNEGEPYGSRIDTWRAWEEATGIKVDFVLTDLSSAIWLFDERRADVIDGLQSTPKLRDRLTFSDAFITLDAALLYSDDLLGITDLDSARPFVIGVVGSGACEEYLLSQGVDYIRAYSDPGALTDAAAAGEIQVFCMLERQANYLLNQRGVDEKFRAAAQLFQTGIHWAVPEADLALYEKVAVGFARIPPQTFRAIEDKWYGRTLLTPNNHLKTHLIQLLEVAGVLAVLGVGALIWNLSLRRRVRIETSARRESEAQLIERVKELRTIERVTDITQEHGGDLAKLTLELARALPQGFWFAEHCHARVTIGEHTGDLIGSNRKVAVHTWPITVDGAARGEITICYDELSPEQEKQGPFLKEQDEMMGLVVARITSQIARLESRNALSQSEDRFRKLFFNTEQPIATIEGGVFTSANRAALNLLGYFFSDSIVGKTPAEISPDQQPDGTSSVERARLLFAEADAKGSVSFDWEHLHADGGKRLVHVLLTAIKGAENTIYQVIWTDVTAQREAEETLRTYRKRLEREVATRTRKLTSTNNELRAILSAASSGIVLIRQGRIAALNPATETLFRAPAKVLLNTAPSDFWASDISFTRFAAQATARLKTGKPVEQEVRLRRRDGTVFWAKLRATIVDIKDIDSGSVWIVNDVTEEREAREKMKEAREMAEEAARVKSDFLSNMSHELRTPLNAIMGFAQILLKTEMTPRQHAHIEKIYASSTNLLQIINDILDLAKAEAGRINVEEIEYDLNQMVRNTVAMITDKAAEKSLEIITRVDPDLHTTFVGDPTRTGQVLLNLLSNAVKFTDIGEISIEVRRRKESGEGEMLYFAVTDTGIGMAPEQTEKLFQSFTQVDSSTTRRYGGTGLGLAICKHFVELMGGTIGLESEAGKGSTFWFQLPYRPGKGMLQRELDPTAFRRDSRVLVLDDNDTARQTICKLLEALTLRGTGISDRESAIGAIREATAKGAPFDAVLLDDDLPGISLDDCVATLRQELGKDSPPIILMVHTSAAEIQAERQSAMIDGVLQKPVDISLLHDALTEAWSRRHAATVPSAIPPSVAMNGMRTQHPALKGRRVLLCDDNPTNIEIAGIYLSEMGMQVSTAFNGAEALDWMGRLPFDIVLMDRRMPVMDGLEATRRIRALPKPAGDVPILALTASGSAESRDEALAAGMNDLVTKPIDFEVLRDALVRLLSDQTTPPDSDARPPRPYPAASEIAPPPEMAALRAVSGLDPDKGLRLTRGQFSTYRTLLLRFVRNVPAVLRALRTMTRETDRKEVIARCHKLRGTAGQIGATALADAAAAIEERLDANSTDHPDPARLRALADQTQALAKAIRAALPAETAAMQAPVTLEPDQIATLLHDIGEAARGHEFRTQTLVESNHAILCEALDKATFAELVRASDQFDFKTVQQLVSQKV